MKLHFDSKFCQYPNTYFPFVLNILLWDRNLLTKVCTKCPFYLHSSTFAALYLIVNLILASYKLFQQILVPIDDPAENDDKLTVPLRFWKINLSFRISHQYLLLGRALFNVQAYARSLYNLLVGNYGSLVGLVLFVPVYFAISVINFIAKWTAHREQGGRLLSSFFWKETLRLGSTIVFWSNMCCLLHNQYAGCIFKK